MLRFSLLLQPPMSNLPELPCMIILSLQRKDKLETWLSCNDQVKMAKALLALSDVGYAVVAVGLLTGKIISPLALLNRPIMAEADPNLSGNITVECPISCVKKIRDVMSSSLEVKWSEHEPNKLRLKTRLIHVSELFERQIRLVDPFRAPP